MFTLPPDAIGLKNCSAPFHGLVLLGIRHQPAAGRSIWAALNFTAPGAKLQQVVCYPSIDESFPERKVVEDRRPILMAAAALAHWDQLHAGNEQDFLSAVLNGYFEIGGNFPRYRQYLEWFLANASRVHLAGILAPSDDGT